MREILRKIAYRTSWNQLSSNVDVSSIESDEIGVTGVDLVHAVLYAGAHHTVEIGLQVLGSKRHYHVLALHHLVVRDDAPAGHLDRTFVERFQALMHVRTYIDTTAQLDVHWITRCVQIFFCKLLITKIHTSTQQKFCKMPVTTTFWEWSSRADIQIWMQKSGLESRITFGQDFGLGRGWRLGSERHYLP